MWQDFACGENQGSPLSLYIVQNTYTALRPSSFYLQTCEAENLYTGTPISGEKRCTLDDRTRGIQRQIRTSLPG